VQYCTPLSTLWGASPGKIHHPLSTLRTVPQCREGGAILHPCFDTIFGNFGHVYVVKNRSHFGTSNLIEMSPKRSSAGQPKARGKAKGGRTEQRLSLPDGGDEAGERADDEVVAGEGAPGNAEEGDLGDEVGSAAPETLVAAALGTPAATTPETSVVAASTQATRLTKKSTGMTASAKKRAATVGGASSSSPPPDAVIFNADYYAQKQLAIDTIQNHPVFNDIFNSEPIPIQAEGVSGHMAIFNLQDYKLAMDNAGSYTCACNIWHANHWSKPQGEIPRNDAANKNLMTHFFSKPTNIFPMTIQVQSVPNPPAVKGAWTLITPMELLDSFIFAVKRDIDDHVCDDDLTKWRTAMLTCPVTFKSLPTAEDVFFAALNMRQALMTQAVAMVHTVTQQVASVMGFLQHRNHVRGTISPKDAAVLFEKRAQMSPGSEKYTEAWIKAAFVVWERLLMVPIARAVILDIEGAIGISSSAVALNSVYALASLCEKTKTLDKLMWVMHSLDDSLKNEYVHPGELTLRNLTGKNAGGKGLIDLFMYKKELRDYLAGPFMESKGFDYESKLAVRNFSADHVEYRKMFGYDTASAGPLVTDLTFMTLLPASTQAFIKLFEAGPLRIQSKSKTIERRTPTFANIASDLDQSNT